jgi:type IV pilus assembly protein PilE
VDGADPPNREKETMGRSKGFTLIELMIAVAILGILGAIAVPMYRGYMEDARKSEAKSNLETLRVIEEQEFQDKGFYTAGATTADLKTALPAWDGGDPAKLSYYYSVIVTPGPPPTFLATAVRKTDATKYFTIDEKGIKLDQDGKPW